MTEPTNELQPIRYAPPRLQEWLLIAVTAIITAVYLPIVIHRATVHGFGDADVFFRAGWAVWTDYPLYSVTDDHGWSYHYPPTFALLMRFFASPLPGHPSLPWTFSFPVAIAVWYVVGAIALFMTTHVWANAIVRVLDLRVRQSFWHPWWAMRIGPVLALLPMAGDSLGRGQPTAIVMLVMASFVALYAQGRRNTAGCVLAVGITAKLFPLILTFILLLRRDVRTLAMIALSCLVLLFAVPALCIGPEKTIELYRVLWTERLSGILTGHLRPNIVKELSPWASDMTSIGATLARIWAGEVLAKEVPLPLWAARTQLIANLAIIAGVAIAGHGRFWRLSRIQPPGSYPIMIAGALLIAALPAMLPTAQTHYWTQALPLLVIIGTEVWRHTGRAIVSKPLVLWSIAAWFGFIATEVDLWRPLRVIGLTTPVMLVLIGAGFVALARSRSEGLKTTEITAKSAGNVA